MFAAAASGRHATTPATILLVEDHRATRTFLADNLAADGYETLEAESAGDAQRLMETKFPDLAIVDLGLPDRDGLELLRHVRESDRVTGRIDPDLPLLVLSGRTGELDRLRGFERGCDDYVVKPFSYPELHARIGRAAAPQQTAAGIRQSPDRAARARPARAPGVAGRRAGGAVEEGVRAAASARRRTDACLHA